MCRHLYIIKHMKIQYASDLHLEFDANTKFLSENPLQVKGDILVLAGDILLFGDKLMNEHPFWDWCSDHFAHTFIVPGNHEYYNRVDVLATLDHFTFPLRKNVTYLNNRSITMGDVELFFTTLWTRVSDEDLAGVQIHMTDCRRIAFGDHIMLATDYARAQRDFADGAYRSYPYDALLLDRDGVINVLRPNDYVKNIAEFVFCDGALEALRRLNPCFRRIVIVTNQRGVGRGLMTEADLAEIHDWMLARIREAGGRIDRIYVCTAVDPADPRRKPNPGMAREVRADFPDIDFARSILVGDSASDLEFARRAGIPAVCLRAPDNLLTFARSLNPTDPS